MTTGRVPFLDVLGAYQELAGETDEAYRRVAGSGWYILGPEVERFEEAWAAYAGASHCVAVASGLDALTLVLMAWGVGRGDEVIVPSNTYIATWIAVSRVGATPVPVEPERQWFNLDPEGVEEAITPRTRAILPVHLYGHPAEMPALCEVASRHGLPVLADGAQAHGALCHGKPVGAFGDAVAWSFYPGKNLGALGDAGGITTDDPGLAEQLRLLRNYGSPKKYVHDTIGLNSRLDPLQAAFLGVRLPHLDEWNARRAGIAGRYGSELGDIGALTLPGEAPWGRSAWHLYVVRTEERDGLARHLDGGGVETLIHYPTPPHRTGAYAHLALGPGSFPVAERMAATVLSLPVGPHLTPADQDRVIAAVRSYFEGW